MDLNGFFSFHFQESRDKFRGWVSAQISSEVDLAYKKVVDSHPLRLWKCAVEVEAPPNEVLERVLNERSVDLPDNSVFTAINDSG